MDLEKKIGFNLSKEDTKMFLQLRHRQLKVTLKISTKYFVITQGVECSVRSLSLDIEFISSCISETRR